MKTKKDEQDQLIFVMQQCIKKTFNEAKWKELAYRTKGKKLILEHPRLLRSLNWGDEDYPGHILDILEGLLKIDPENLDIIRDHIELDKWLKDNPKYETMLERTPTITKEVNEMALNQDLSSTELLTLINTHFNDEELRSLCFSLTPRVDYDSLVGQGKAGKIRELVLYCERLGQYEDLVKKTYQARPHLRQDSSSSSSPKVFATSSSVGANPEPVVKSGLKIFLCHASSDKEVVRELYQSLQSDGFNPWLDEEDLLPGQKWRVEIPKAVRSSDLVLVCLSQKAVDKRGYVQREIKIALDEAEEIPEEDIFVIPARLEECKVPDRLSHLQWVNLYDERGYEHLLKALKESTKSSGLSSAVGQRQLLDLGDIKDLIVEVDWARQREGYLASSPLGIIKDKLSAMRNGLTEVESFEYDFDEDQLQQLLDVIQENMKLLFNHDYGDIEDPERFRQERLAPLFRLQVKLRNYTSSSES